MTAAAGAWLPDGLGLAAYGTMGVLVLVGACLQGIGGIGFAMFASPLAALAFPAMVSGPLLLLGGLVSLMAALRERAAIDWPLARHCILGRCVGAGVAVAVMSTLLALVAGSALVLLGKALSG